MAKSSIVIGSSVVAALLVLGLALVLGPEPASKPDAPSADALAPPAPRGTESPQATADQTGERGDDDLAPGFDPQRVISRERFGDSQIFDDVGGGYTIVQGDRRIIMTWQRLSPRPQGVSEVTEPIAWVFFDERRMLRIAAEKGMLVAPRNEPREGRLEGKVTLSWYDAGNDDQVDPDTLRHVLFRIDLDEAEFDLELGHLESEGPVRLVGRRVEFEGVGLRLTYNELRNRIERLEVVQGRSLRFNTRSNSSSPWSRRSAPWPESVISTPPAPVEAAGPRLASASDDATSAALTASADDSTEENAPGSDAPSNAPTDASQFYRATFHDRVRATVGPDRLHTGSDRLEAVFSLETESAGDAAGENANDANGDSSESNDGTQRGRENGADAAGEGGTDNQAGAGPATDLFEQKEDDVLIRWTGRLLVLPMDTPPTDFASSDDLLLTLSGHSASDRLARARTGGGQSIEGHSIDYLASSGRLRAQASEDQSVRLLAPELGTLSAGELFLDQSRGTGTLTGPGTLRAPLNVSDAPGSDAMTEASVPLATSETRETSGAEDELRVTWAERLEVSFYHDQDEPRIRALREAVFHGDVEAHHPQFDLGAQRLDVALSEAEENTLQRLEASGAVALGVRPTDEPPLDLEAERLTIELERDALGQRRPHRFTATGDVRVDLDDPPTQLVGQRLFADLDSDVLHLLGQADDDLHQAVDGDARAEAIGTDGTDADASASADDDDAALARVVQRDAVLAGRRITMHRHERMIHVEGRGWFDAQLDGDAPAEDLRVRWARSMRYDDAAGRAHFVGEVRADTRQAEARAWLTSDDLQLHLAADDDSGEHEPGVSAAEYDASVDAAENERHADESDATASVTRRIRRATASGSSRFTAERVDPISGAVVAKLRLDGDPIIFDGDSEQVRVPGAGRMLVQDHRPDSASDDRDDTSASRPTAARISSRGDTLFIWQGHLTFDAQANEVLMERDVQMVHESSARVTDGAAEADVDKDEPRLVQFDAQRMLTRFAGAGGMAGWGVGDAPELAIELIRAGGAVRIIHGPREVSSDHLQYTRQDQSVRLWSEQEKLVRVQHDDEPTGLSARQVIWDLGRDRFEATELGPGIVPLPR